MDNRQVGCETTDGLLNVHSVEETCEVCAPADVQGEVPKRSETEHSDVWPCEHCAALDPNYLKKTTPKHKHVFTTDADACECGALRCGFTVSDRKPCKKIATETGLCRKHEAEKDKPQPFWSADRITDILKNSDKTTTLESGKVVKNSLIIYRFLQRMFERQTADEQQSFNTSHDNGIGFAGCDARLLSDIATGSLKFNTDYKAKYNRVNGDGLTVRQAKYVASRLTKYVKTQLVEIANEATSDAAQMPETPTQQSIQDLLRRSDGYKVSHFLPAVQPEIELEPTTFREEREAAMGADVRAALQNPVDAKIEELKTSDPTKYYDPFGEDEHLSEEDAKRFWTKRFRSQA